MQVMITYIGIKSKLRNIGQIAIEHGANKQYKELRSRIVVTKNVSSVLYEVVYNDVTVFASFNLEEAIESYNEIELTPKYIFQRNIIMESENGTIVGVKLSNHVIISRELNCYADSISENEMIAQFEVFCPNWGIEIFTVMKKSIANEEDLMLIDPDLSETYISSDFFAVYIGE